MSFDKSDTISSLEEIHSHAAKIQCSLSDLYYSLKKVTPRSGDLVTVDRVMLAGSSAIIKDESVAVQALCDSLRTLIVMIDQSTAVK